MIISSVFMIIFFPVAQSLATGGLQNLDLWFRVIPKVNLFLLGVYSILFGALLSLQIYNFKSKECDIEQKVAGASTTGVSAVIASLVPACPACLSWVSLLLPASFGLTATIFMIKYNGLILLGSIILLLAAMYLLGGFKRK